MAERMNRFGSTVALADQRTPILVSRNGVVFGSGACITDFNTCKDVVLDEWRNFCTFKPPGMYAINPKLLGAFRLFIYMPSTRIIYKSLKNGKFPECLKNAVITPIVKKTETASFSDYRPIFFVFSLSKVFAKLGHRRASDYVKSAQMWNPLQSGFRNNNSSETASLNLVEDLRSGIFENNVEILVLLKVAKAFESIDYGKAEILRDKLRIVGGVLKWVLSYIDGRKQFVRW